MLELSSNLITSVLNILLGLFIVLRRPNSWTNRLFFILTCTIAVYVWVNYLSLHPPVNTPEVQLFWIRLVMAVTSLIGPILFFLVLVFPRDKQVIPVPAVVGILILGTCTFLASLGPWVFASISYPDGKPVPAPGPLIPLFFIDFVGLFILSFIVLLIKVRRTVSKERAQIRLFLLGILGTFTSMALTTVIFVVVLKLPDFVIFGPLSSLILISCLAYGIVRHQFLDISVLIVRATSYIVLVMLLAIVYGAITVGIGTAIFSLSLTPLQLILLTAISVMAATGFYPLQRLLERTTNVFFFKDRYELDHAFAALTNIMATTFRLPELTAALAGALGKILKTKMVDFVLKNKEGQYYCALRGGIIRAEDLSFLYSIQSAHDVDSVSDKHLESVMRKYHLQYIFPIQTGDMKLGICILTMKQNGEPYGSKDIKLLHIFSNQAAIAIANAQSYQQVLHFNERLTNEVDQATHDLKDANVRLQELGKLKDEFVSMASHELRTPMAAIKGSISTVLEGYAGPLSDDAREFLTAAYNENDRLIRLVNNLLNTSRIEANRFSFTITAFDINKVLSEVVKNMQIAGKEKHIYIRYISDGRTLPQVKGDEDKIREVLINLIGNAVKFTSTGGITITSEVEGGFVKIIVEDTGTGIHNEDFELLFKKFSQVKTQYTKTLGGTGLGLYICKKIIEGLGGKIWLESEVGKGTTFYFTLPTA